MAKLIINDNVEINISNFNQNLSKSGNNIDLVLSVQLIVQSTQNDLTARLKEYLEDNSVDTIKIVEDNKVLYYTEVYTNINNVSFGANFDEGNNVNTITGYLNFELHSVILSE